MKNFIVIKRLISPLSIILCCALLVLISSCNTFPYGPKVLHDEETIQLLQSLRKGEPEIILQQRQDTIIKTDFLQFQNEVRESAKNSPESAHNYESLVSIVLQESKKVNPVDLFNIVADMNKGERDTPADYLSILKTGLLEKGKCMVICGSKIAKEVKYISHTVMLLQGRTLYMSINQSYRVDNDIIYHYSSDPEK